MDLVANVAARVRGSFELRGEIGKKKKNGLGEAGKKSAPAVHKRGAGQDGWGPRLGVFVLGPFTVTLGDK